MDEPLRVSGRLTIPAAELVERFSRSGGPGGQHVNTSDTRVELSFDVERSPSLSELYRERALHRLDGRLVDGVITIVASGERSQLRNREAARERLAALLGEATAPPPKPRRKTRPSRGATEARLLDKKRRSNVKKLRRPGADD